LFDVPVEVSIARLATARQPDKFERESADFFTRIRNAYLQRAVQYPERFEVIDANCSIEDVWQSVHDAIASI
ncbi:MAG TPA: dTMP kinase, partial [Methyloradius sp.]